MREGTTTYSYDAMGNLLKVVLPDNRVITYKVDARGRRIAKYVDGVFIYRFIYADQLNPIAKVDESGNIVEYYVYGLKSNIPEYVVKDNVKYKIISDHLGSPLAVWQEGENTSPILEIKYDSFGNIIEQNGDFELPFRFAGGIWDEDTKLIRFGVRDYDSETGRWTSVEPLGFAGARNWYVYAGNDGVNYLDLDGRIWWCKRALKTFDEQHGELSHEYLCTSDGICRGLTTDSLIKALLYIWSKGHLTKSGEDKLAKEPNDEDITCYEIDTRSCMDRCLKDVFKHEYMSEEYHLYMYNCHDWAYDAYDYCSVNCSYY